MDIFLHYFNTAFPYKRVKSKELIYKRWLSNGLLVLGKRMQVLKNLKTDFILKMEALDYIKKYQTTYEGILREAKMRDNDRYVLETKDKTKAMWQSINRGIGKVSSNDLRSDLKIGNSIGTNPTEVAA